MARATRTLNPLHFEDLEPHRFEDLVRQLAYEYRPWASIEATGRGGADDGIDIRAFEQGSTLPPEELEEDDLPPLVAAGRLWIIQCKREKRIGPAQVRRYVQESVRGPDVPYGFIFAAACDFSKKAYDAFRLALIGTGVQEFQLWGKAELEDMLFQPKNDHLLFAYFGISLQTRKRTKQSELRATLALRKRLLRAFKSETGDIDQEALLLDADCTEYPYVSQVATFNQTPLWGIFKIRLIHPQHFLVIEVRRQLAYANAETGAWDVLESGDIPVTHEELYEGPERIFDPEAGRRYEAWQRAVPHPERAQLVTMTWVPLDRIIGILEAGDVVHRLPILYVLADASGRLTSTERRQRLEFTSWTHQVPLELEPEKRIPFFKDFRLEEKDASGS